MISKIKKKAKEWLLWSQQYTQTDMFYIAKSGFWTSFGFGITSITSLILVVAFANLLPKDIYGTYRYIMSLVGALGFLTFSGMNTALTQAVARGQEGIIHYALKVQLKWNLLFLAVLALISGYYFISGNTILSWSLLILGLAFPFTAAFNTYGAFLVGKKDFRRSSLFGTISGSIYSLCMIFAILLTRNVVILVLTYALANMIPMIYFYFLTIKKYKPSGHNTDEEKKIFNYGAHLSLINIFSNLSQYADKISIFHFLGSIELAVYGLAMAGPERIRGYSKNLGAMILPKLSNKTIIEITPIFYKRLLQSLAVGALISLGYILIAPLAFKILLPKYLESIRYSQVISLASIFTIPASYMSGVFHSQKMLRTIYLSSTVAHISRIVLFIVFGAVWGIWGVIYASLLVYGLGFFFNILLWELEIKKYKKLINLGNVHKQTLTK